MGEGVQVCSYNDKIKEISPFEIDQIMYFNYAFFIRHKNPKMYFVHNIYIYIYMYAKVPTFFHTTR